ncbi:hypothetical protein F0562_027478 [Nyssa sinensis]|uniref:Uncharacterized protein n=1 Tax=Nyssa sinensis TaxID=561372 RepID=A0A5J5B7T1_9ASTE|nr:hypothetical protein F0562_027478 [Nyssa sinensis]
MPSVRNGYRHFISFSTLVQSGHSGPPTQLSNLDQVFITDSQETIYYFKPLFEVMIRQLILVTKDLHDNEIYIQPDMDITYVFEASSGLKSIKSASYKYKDPVVGSCMVLVNKLLKSLNIVPFNDVKDLLVKAIQNVWWNFTKSVWQSSHKGVGQQGECYYAHHYQAQQLEMAQARLKYLKYYTTNNSCYSLKLLPYL